MKIETLGKHTAIHGSLPRLLTYNDITNILASDLGVVVPFLENMPAGSRQSGGSCENMWRRKMAKFDWGFDILNKDTAQRDGVVQVRDTKTNATGHFALSEYLGDGEWGDCIYAENGFREHDAYGALSTWGWI